MPLIIKLPKYSCINVLGVTLRAEKQCAISIDDDGYKFVKATDTEPRKIIPKEATE